MRMIGTPSSLRGGIFPMRAWTTLAVEAVYCALLVWALWNRRYRFLTFSRRVQRLIAAVCCLWSFLTIAAAWLCLDVL